VTSIPPHQNIARDGGRLSPPETPQKRSLGPNSPYLEKRTAKRSDITTEITFESETNFYVGFTADVSAGGLFVVTWNTVPIGSEISINFSLPDSKEIVKADGVVRWVREFNPSTPDLWPGMGVQFDNLPKETVKMIEEFISEREPLFYE